MQNPQFTKTVKSTKNKIHPLIAYDLETTRIESGTPKMLYITAYGDGDLLDDATENHFKLSVPITGKNKAKVCCQLLEQHLLIRQNDGARFVAWNGNKFDAYFIAIALLESDRWILQPYMTASKQLRGLKVTEIRTDNMLKRYRPLRFEFLDGIAMTGITVALGDKETKQGDGAIKIKKGFLSTFAPNYSKLKGPDFEKGESFDYQNKEHVKYAERDSEGLYHGMKKVSEIVYNLTAQDLKPTVGNLAIKHFMANLPDGVIVKRPTDSVAEHLYGPLKKGGYCWATRQYEGPCWKYDMNQAYAAAMRDAALPCGDVVHINGYQEGKPGIYQAQISTVKKTKVPFYYKDEKGVGKFNVGTPITCWLTSIEIEHLKQDGWQVKVITGYYWNESFNMKYLVDKLETLRSTDKDGPNGPLGSMIKALGCNAYGKTLEQIWGDEFIFSKKQPDGFTLYDPYDPSMKYVYARTRDSIPKKYHIPQIGVFITAHVRCIVRDAAKYAEDSFLYADTDCVAFTKKAHHLHLDNTRYGSWKVESAGEEYIIIGKKVMYRENGGAVAKGLVVKNLTKQDFVDWKAGKIPVQEQIQRQNFLKVVSGHAMFKLLRRTGTDVSKLKNVKVLYGDFIPM